MNKSLNKALDIIECFEEKECYSFSELCKKTGQTNATVNRILRTFSNKKFINKDKKTGLYYLGEKFFILGFLLFKNLEFAQIVKPVLEELSNITGETANASILFENYIVFIDTVEGKYSVKMSTKIGRRNTLNCSASGKALISFFTDREIDLILNSINLPKYNENTITNKNEFRKELKRTSELGYAIDNEEEEIGLKCIAGPVFNCNGKVVGAISISGPSRRINNNFELFIKQVKEACSIASKKLGYFKI